MKLNFFLSVFFFSTLSIAQNEIASEDILVMNDSIQLPGTLTFNPDLNKQPLLIYVSGSGNPDRNGNQPQYGVNGNYIRQFAETMTKKGIAVFRYDKRNVTSANAKFILKDYEFIDLVEDVTMIIDIFKNDNRFNSINLIGHSQGSLVAMMAVNNDAIEPIAQEIKEKLTNVIRSL